MATKILKTLTVLALAGLGASALAVVDCEGLKEYNGKSGKGFSKYMQGPSSYDQCITFNKRGYSWDYVDKITGEIRYQNEQWDGIRRYKDGKKQYSSYSGGSNEKLSPEARQEKRACENSDSYKRQTQIFNCFQLAIKYEKGKGVSRNKAKALEYYKKACNLGDSIACKEYKRVNN
jgi:TPR repeat protein